MTYARRVDGNHRQIVEALRDLGWDVEDTSRLGGFVDLVAWHHGRQALRLIEIKDGKAQLTVSQKRFLERNWPITVIRTLEDATKL